MNFRTSKFALLLGAINGVIFCLIYQPVKIEFVKYLWSIKNDNYVYVVLPEIYRIARDVGEFFVWTILFTLASYTAHHFWAKSVKSTVLLWLRIGIISLAVPIFGLWIFRFLIILVIFTTKQFDLCFFVPVNCAISSNELMSSLVRESANIKFEFLLLIVAVVVNLIYGTILSELSKRFAK